MQKSRSMILAPLYTSTAFSPSLRTTPLVHSNNKFSLTTALAVFLLVYSYLLSLGPFLLQDPDTFWHIRTGQWILDHATFPDRRLLFLHGIRKAVDFDGMAI